MTLPAQAFDSVDVIRTKRDGGSLSDEQIDWVIAAYTRGDVADEQMSALAMAILLNGMDRRESVLKSIRSPDAIIAAVQVAISRWSMPLRRIAIARADICSSATTPRV